MKIKYKVILGYVGLICINLALLLQQASFYQFFHLSNLLRNVCVVIFIICGLLLLINSKCRFMVLKNQITSILLIIYMIFIGFVNSNSFERIYWATIDFIVYIMCLHIFRSVKDNDKKIVLYFEFIVFCFAASMYFFSKFNYSFYTSGEHSSPMFPFMLIPFIGLLEKKRYLFISLIIMLFISFLESGRTIFILTMLVLLYSIIKIYGEKTGAKGIVIIGLIFLVSLVSGLCLYKYSLRFTGYSFIEKTIDAGDSHRIELYKNVIDKYFKNGFINIIFGSGFMSTTLINRYNFMAHNDFLEMLYDYGVIGFSLFILWFITLFKELTKSRIHRKNIASIFIAIYILILLCFSNNVFFNFGAVSYLMIFFALIESDNLLRYTHEKNSITYPQNK